VARQPADGYTLLLAPASNLTVQPALFKQLSYDLSRDFTPVSLLVQTPQVLLVNPKLPVVSPRELIDYSKKNPGKVNYGISVGAYSHLAGELLKTQTGADFTAIPYQGSAPAINDLLAGQTQFIFNEVVTAIPFVKAGTLKPLAVAYRTRAPWLPDVPTTAEAGLPGYEVYEWNAVFVPAGTPAPVAERLSKEFAAALKDPEVRSRLEALGAEVIGSSPAELDSFRRAEIAKWTKLAKDNKIQMD